MSARVVVSFHPPRLRDSSCFSSKPFVSPTCRIAVRNSFVSPTYAKTGGCTPLEMSARRHFLSLCSLSPLSALLLFNGLRTLLFSVAHLSPVAPALSALFPKDRGCTPLDPNQLLPSGSNMQNPPALEGGRYTGAVPPVTNYQPALSQPKGHSPVVCPP